MKQPYENFEKIPVEDQQRILQACIAEFASNGYRQASTNTIVKQAGIPKGTLFYFFGSKKDLFLYVVEHAVRRYAERQSGLAGELPADLFERLLHLSRARFRFAAEEPELFRLFYNAFIHAPEEIQAALRERAGGYAAASAEMLTEGLDRSKFREGVEVEQAVALIHLMLDGLLNRYLGKFKRMSPAEGLALVERITGECRQYFELIRQGIYKE